MTFFLWAILAAPLPESHYQKGYLFPGNKGGPYARLWKPFQEIAKILGVPFSTHSLRHASATYLYEQTNDIYQVQAHLRHRKLATSQIYTRVSVRRRQSAVNSIIDYATNS